jgi:hypothetical protein
MSAEAAAVGRRKGRIMAAPDQPEERLTAEELASQDGEPLPPREAMSTMDVRLAPTPEIGPEGNLLHPVEPDVSNP